MKNRDFLFTAAFAVTCHLTFTPPAKAADVTATWTTAGSANWADGPKWTCVPGPNVAPDNDGVTTYDAVIAAVGTPYTVAVASDIAIQQLTLNSADATVELQSNTLWAQTGIALANGVLLLNGGTLIGTTVTPTGGSFVCTSDGGNILHNSTLNGDLLLNQLGAGHVVRLRNNASFTGNAQIGNPAGDSAGFGYEQTGTLNGKTLNFANANAFLSIDGDHTMTFGPSLVARGAGSIGQAHFVGGTSTLVNNGLISSDLAGQTLTINPNAFTNQGIAEAINGATLTLQAADWSSAAGGTVQANGAGSILNFYGNYSNAGTIALVNSTLNLHGNCTTAGLGLAGFSRSGACEVNLLGDLNNAASIFALTATAGDWNLQGGRIIGGNIVESGGAKLRFTANGNNRLDNATFIGDLLLNEPGAAHVVRLQNGATFTGNAYLGPAAPDGNQGGFGYEQDGTLNGKTLNFADDNGFLSIDGDHTLTFGPTLVARGAGRLGQARFVGGTSTLVNQGRISADLADGTLTINPSVFTNQGIVEALAGAVANIYATTWSNAAGGTFKATGTDSVLNLYGDFSNAGTIVLTDGTLGLHGTCTTAGLGLAGFSRTGTCVVNLTGDLDNRGSTFALTASTGDWTLIGGRIIGGTITEAGGARLRFAANGNNRLDNATFTGDLLLNQPGGGHLVRLQNGATFTGNAYLGPAAPDGNRGGIGYEQDGTLNGKTLNFTGVNGFLSIDGDHTLTFGPSLVARGSGNIGQAQFVGGTSTLINEGLISADLAGQTLTLNPSVFTNQGIAEAINGATLNLQADDWSSAAGGTVQANGAGSILNFYGNYSNTGTTVLVNSTLNLHGNCTTAGLGLADFSRSGTCEVNLIGDLDNRGSTFALTAATGDWKLSGGRILGGTITEAGGAKLRFTADGGNRLDNAIFTGDLLLNQPGATHIVRLQNGASFNGNAYLGPAAPDGNQGGFGYEQDGTLDGKTLYFTDGNGFLSIDGDHTLTFGPTLVARGAGSLGAAHFVGGASTLVNKGRISADLAGQALTINPAVFTNHGIAEARPGATLTFQATTGWSNAASGVLYGNGAGSVLNLYGEFSNTGTTVLADATLNLHGNCTTAGLGLAGFSRSGTCEVKLIGNLDNRGSTFALTAATGDWTLDGGRIIGGTITRTGGANLLFSNNGGNRLDNATLTGDLLLDQPGAGHIVRLQNGATFTGNAVLGNYDGTPGVLGYEQTGTLDGKTLQFFNANSYLSIDGDNTLTFGPNLWAQGSGSIGQAHFVGGTSTLVNQGYIISSQAGQTMTINPSVFTNEGWVEAYLGSLVIQATTLTNLQGTTLNGGKWGSSTGATLWINSGGFTSNAAVIYLGGPGSRILVTPSQIPVEDLLTSNTSGGTLNINNRDFITSNAFSNAGTIDFSDATLSFGSLTIAPGGRLVCWWSNNASTVFVRPTNSGHIWARGPLVFANGIQSSGGDTVTADYILNLSAGASTGSSADFLVINGNIEGNLVLGTKTFAVGVDYTNANFGTGNSFAPRANVSGTGAINAVGGTGQTLSGNVTGGATATPTMDFGKVRVGDAPTLSYQINNPGTSGARLRGAIQTSVNGGNLTDPRLSGAGVTAENFGPFLPGGNSGSLAVTFTVSDAGPLTGQTIRLLNNFDNVGDQTLSITGGAYRYAAPSNHTPEPVAFGNFHVGAPAPSQLLTISNQAANDTFSESLNASIGGATGGVTTNGGSFIALAPGASNGSSLAVAIGTKSAGSKNGTATISLTSNGDGSSELGLTPLPAQTVTVTGGVYRLAQAALPGGTTLDFGIVHVGEVAQQEVKVTNAVAADGFSEALDGSFSGSTGQATGSGSFTALAPGGSSGAAKVTLDTTAAGAKSGTATLVLVSTGTGSSGLADSPLTAQVITATGQVNHYAAALVTRDGGAATLTGGGNAYTVNFGRRTLDEAPPVITLRLTNSAAAPADTLAGSFATAAPDFTLSGFGSFSNLAAGQSRTNLTIALQTDSLGTFSQTITLNGLSQNTGGFSGALGPVTITLTGEVVGEGAVAPTLKIQVAGASAVLSWPLAEQDWVLHKSSDLIGWSAVTEPVVNTATEHTVTTPCGGAPELFFRLEK